MFTKAMGEMLVGHFGRELPVVIIRPSIVSSIYHDPLPGWIEGTRYTSYLLIEIYSNNWFTKPQIMFT